MVEASKREKKTKIVARRVADLSNLAIRRLFFLKIKLDIAN